MIINKKGRRKHNNHVIIIINMNTINLKKIYNIIMIKKATGSTPRCCGRLGPNRWSYLPANRRRPTSPRP